MAAIEVDNLPMTTTYTIDVGGDAQHVTTGAFSWIENFRYQQLTRHIQAPLFLETVETSFTMTILCFTFGTSAKVQATHYGHLPPSIMISCIQDITGTCTAAYGMLYFPGYDGYMHAINMTTGVQLWDSIS